MKKRVIVRFILIMGPWWIMLAIPVVPTIIWYAFTDIESAIGGTLAFIPITLLCYLIGRNDEKNGCL